MSDEIKKYDDLKLGEKARQAYLRGASVEEIARTCPVYLNTRPVFSGLNVTDLAIAAVLAGLNSFYVGDTGTGKSQLARDFYNYYFGGEKDEGGEGVSIEGHSDLDIYSDVLTRIDMEKGKRVLTGIHEALFWNLEEFNRCPEVTQNQFYAMGNGRLIYGGKSIPIGQRGYVSSVATANLGNGEFRGTFDTDKALYNRFPVTIDFDNPKFRPTLEDRILIDLIREANPNVKEAPVRDFSNKIARAQREIASNSQNPGLETLAVVNYLKLGLENCSEKRYDPNVREKGKTWPIECQDCSINTDGKALCSLVRSPLPRTLESLKKYAAALDYLAKLKNPEQKIDPVDLVFDAFEIIGAYQKLLNPQVLTSKYAGQNPRMVKDVVEELRGDFRKNEDFILTSLEQAKKGNENFDAYFEQGGKNYLGYSQLSRQARGKVRKINPFQDRGRVGLSWVNGVGSVLRKVSERDACIEKQKNEKINGDKENDK